MDQQDEDLLERAYRRRMELMAQPGVRWVRMTLEKRGVTFVVEGAGGVQRSEWMERSLHRGLVAGAAEALEPG